METRVQGDLNLSNILANNNGGNGNLMVDDSSILRSAKSYIYGRIMTILLIDDDSFFAIPNYMLCNCTADILAVG